MLCSGAELILTGKDKRAGFGIDLQMCEGLAGEDCQPPEAVDTTGTAFKLVVAAKHDATACVAYHSHTDQVGGLVEKLYVYLFGKAGADGDNLLTFVDTVFPKREYGEGSKQQEQAAHIELLIQQRVR